MSTNFPDCFVMPKSACSETVCLICQNLKCPTKIKLLGGTLLIDLQKELCDSGESIENYTCGNALREYAERLGLISPTNSQAVDWEGILKQIEIEEEILKQIGEEEK